MCVCVCVCVLTNPSVQAGCDTSSIFSQSLSGLNLEFSFSKTSSHTKIKELSLPYYLAIAGGRIVGFIPSTRLLVLFERQTALSNILTWFTMSISYDDNHCTMRTSLSISLSLYIYIYIYIQWCPPASQDYGFAPGSWYRPKQICIEDLSLSKERARYVFSFSPSRHIILMSGSCSSQFKNY